MAETLQLTLTCEGPDDEGTVDVRLTVFNPSGEAVTFDRALLYGPHPGRGELVMLASEPTPDDGASSVLVLNPLCFYGRQRRYRYPDGEMTFHGYLITEVSDGLLPTGPTDPAKAVAVADPLRVTFG